MKKILLSVCAFGMLSNAFASNEKVIYGKDNRMDVYETTNATYLELAKSTAAQIPFTSLSMTEGDDVQVVGRTMQSRNICAKERFSQQITAARCSGFLVGEDLLVTAGHCITNDADCANFAWVFDYRITSASQTSVSVKKDDVYKCSKIISRSLDNSTKNDFALIKLDRVSNRAPLKFRTEGKVANDAKLLMIGHPTGLPTKIEDGAQVRNNSNSIYFIANTDSYGGNSGSAVFNLATNEVEGILVRGEQDFVYDYSAQCQVSKVCADNGCRGEDITRITNFKVLKNL